MPDLGKTGRLLNIAVKESSRSPMKLIPATNITQQGGIEVEDRSYASHRKITVLSRESWVEACAEIEADLPWTTRRANLLVEGLNLQGTTGRYLRIGNTILEVTGETSPCGQMEEAHRGLQASLTSNWRGGVTCKVIRSGSIAVGDKVQITDS